MAGRQELTRFCLFAPKGYHILGVGDPSDKSVGKALRVLEVKVSAFWRAVFHFQTDQWQRGTILFGLLLVRLLREPVLICLVDQFFDDSDQLARDFSSV